MTKGINNKDWKPVAFGEMCSNLNESLRNPLANGIERYVGLEHIETGNLHIKNWGNISDGTTFTKRFRKGQVLFGKRRAYLRKAAMADFDGICSGDILVFEANEKVINPALLPFIVSSDKFLDYAVQTSAGSLSPRTKFQDLAKLIFLLPPKDQQAKLVELLWAADGVVEKYNSLEFSLKNNLQTYLDIKFSVSKNRIDNFNQNIASLKDCIIGKAQYGANAPSMPFVENSPRYIRITDLNDDGYLIAEDRVTINSSNYEDYLLSDGDFLFARTGNTVGKTLLYKEDMGHCVYAGYLIRFKLNPEILLPDYLDLFCRTTYYRDFIRKSVKVGAQPNINAEQYSNMLIPLPTLKIQRQILNQFVKFKSSLDQNKNILNQCNAIQKQLINQIFS